MTGSAFEECRFRAATCLSRGWGSGPSCLSSPPHAVGACAGGSTICDHDNYLHISIERAGPEEEAGDETNDDDPPPPPPPIPDPPPSEGSVRQLMDSERELTTGLLSREASFRLIVSGPVGVKEIERLIKKLELDKEILADEGEEAISDE
jgi:hypothetical protein